MKPSLQLKFGQQLAMTPQLQQAIRLLQLSTLDLQQEIQEALNSNPLLEIEDLNNDLSDNAEQNLNDDNQYSSASTSDDLKLADTFDTPSPSTTTESLSLDELALNNVTENDFQVPDSSDLIDKSEISNELEIDTTWDDIYSANSGNTGIALDDEMPIYQGETTQSLQDYLLWQLDLTPFSDTDRTIAQALIDAIDDYGYLTIPLEEILDNFDHKEIELDEIEAVRKRIQQFDPLGVASINLQDCLLLQLATFPEETPWLNEAKNLLRHYIDQLGNRDYKIILKDTKLKESELKEILTLIQSLDPRPGSSITPSNTEYVVPDVIVYKEFGRWNATINPDSVPRLKINQQYAQMGKGNSVDSQYIRTNLQEAKWLIKSLESRNETLLKVTRYIIEHQYDFFEHGEEFMKPMVLNDVALAIEMHESTISRVTTQKFMHTPRGVFELKYFFSSHVGTDSGGECSSTAIRALIKKLTSEENSAKPLSDSKIATLLAEQGIQVARRTIAKYRESLGIAPSSQRKRLI